MTAIPPGTRLGPYEIRSALGSGAMGEVYRARDTRLQRLVAVKVMRRATRVEPTQLQRFEQEARALAALNHPNVLIAFDVGTFDGYPFVVSELLEGGNLREVLRERTALPLRTAIEFCTQIARGLTAAHDQGIVHRDLKPENVFVTRDGRIKVLDFGLARFDPPPSPDSSAGVEPTQVETEPGLIFGTIGYMAPEQLRGGEADHRSDLFGLGAILYELLSGRRAFQGATRADVALAILHEDRLISQPVADGFRPHSRASSPGALRKHPSGGFNQPATWHSRSRRSRCRRTARQQPTTSTRTNAVPATGPLLGSSSPPRLPY